MQNSEAVQAWIQGKMATFRILILVSKTEIRSRELSILSQKPRLDQGSSRSSLNTRYIFSRSRLEAWDYVSEILGLVSMDEIE